MNSVDLFLEEQRMVETVLAILETLVERLNAREPLQNAILGNIVDFFREFEDAVYDAGEASEGHSCLSKCVAKHETARVYLRGMQWSLESLEDGEAGAAGAFVINARAYIRAYRDSISVDDSYFPKPTSGTIATVKAAPTPDQEETRQRRAVLRRFSRLVERYRGLTSRVAGQNA